MKAAAGSTIPVGPAIPFWFDGIEDVEWEGQRRPLSERVQDLYDYVAIMDYRNFAGAIRQHHVACRRRARLRRPDSAVR